MEVQLECRYLVLDFLLYILLIWQRWQSWTKLPVCHKDPHEGDSFHAWEETCVSEDTGAQQLILSQAQPPVSLTRKRAVHGRSEGLSASSSFTMSASTFPLQKLCFRKQGRTPCIPPLRLPYDSNGGAHFGFTKMMFAFQLMKTPMTCSESLF